MGCGCGGQKGVKRGSLRPVVGPTRRAVKNKRQPASVLRKKAIQEELNAKKTTGQITNEAKLKKLRKKAIMRALGKG